MKRISITCLILLLSVTVLMGQKSKKWQKAKAEVYGTGCGMWAAAPDLRIEVQLLVEKKYWPAIEDWLYSKTLSKRVYAYEAILSNQELKESISNKSHRRMKTLRKRRKKILVCSSCSYWDESIRETIECIENENNNN